ncbi:SDR family oxidoreductase [Albimonas pacifica]|uniref:Saccharopine dehydrogenase NADP binding domain-containing protein n=1 Tax=Albimonas pacifica TaxID=1114924 RepID=A0A1I3BLQ4_9RHOB|nr:SDR family oxidoreductase [Albimonas pacifica]SFH63207.1 Saccharopine dehydrogenase NADP binding domain-containing protein [Albimonas pacifica]
MKVLVLGGYGVFGARLARLLVRDGHAVTVAGRSLAPAQALAAELGCAALRMDREGDLRELDGHDVVIDAAGPFHAYGDDPLRLPRTALARGLHYLDLADDARFCAGIAALDGPARAAGRCAISGLSSTPALSSAAVRALVGRETPRLIDCAILPGNRSPRGRSVMRSILAQAGRPMRVRRGGAWTEVPGWSDPADYRLPGGLVRQGWQIETPDQALFPAHFGAETALFRAGLELAAMRYGLAAFARLRRRWPVPISSPLLAAFKAGADLLAPFGSGVGGMSVGVVVGAERRTWALRVDDGDGPFIPAVAARALLRRASLPVGARPALEAVTLAEAEAAMADLSVRVERRVEPFAPIFPRVLGPAFETLPQAVRATHLTADVSRWRGRASVTRGEGAWSRLLAAVFGFPAAAEDVPVEVVKTATPRGETWLRRFDGRGFRSHLCAGADGMTERFGPFAFRLGLRVEDGALHYPVRAGRIGPLPLPAALLPVSVAREYADAEGFRFDVELRAPLTRGLLVRYRGRLAPEGDAAAGAAAAGAAAEV